MLNVPCIWCSDDDVIVKKEPQVQLDERDAPLKFLPPSAWGAAPNFEAKHLGGAFLRNRTFLGSLLPASCAFWSS